MDSDFQDGPLPLAGILRLEGSAAILLGVVAYAHLDAHWLLFALLLFLPDLSMLGYLSSPEVGAMTYNLAHTYLTPAVVAIAGWISGSDLLLIAASIWVAHIGLDRLLGYGLKLPTGFQHTHLGPIGKAK